MSDPRKSHRYSTWDLIGHETVSEPHGALSKTLATRHTHNASEPAKKPREQCYSSEIKEPPLPVLWGQTWFSQMNSPIGLDIGPRSEPLRGSHRTLSTAYFQEVKTCSFSCFLSAKTCLACSSGLVTNGEWSADNKTMSCLSYVTNQYRCDFLVSDIQISWI